MEVPNVLERSLGFCRYPRLYVRASAFFHTSSAPIACHNWDNWPFQSNPRHRKVLVGEFFTFCVQVFLSLVFSSLILRAGKALDYYWILCIVVALASFLGVVGKGGVPLTWPERIACLGSAATAISLCLLVVRSWR